MRRAFRRFCRAQDLLPSGTAGLLPSRVQRPQARALLGSLVETNVLAFEGADSAKPGSRKTMRTGVA